MHDRIAEYGGSWDELKQYLRARDFSIERLTERVGAGYCQPFLKATTTA